MSANDEGGGRFLQELQVNLRLTKPCTVLLAPPGSVIGQFDGRASKDQMVAQLVAAQNNPLRRRQVRSERMWTQEMTW